MSIITASSINKSFGFGPILADVHFDLGAHDKIGVVGPNGAGKSTLMRLITKEETPDSGHLAWRKNLTVGYLSQLPDIPGNTAVRTVIEGAFSEILALHAQVEALTRAMGAAQSDNETLTALGEQYDACLSELLRRDGYTVHSRVEGILDGMGFSSALLATPFGSLSGGERTKVALARALARNPDLLVLDEPTNHLDLPALEWLEDDLKRFPGALLVVSHDRYFLDQVVQRIWEVESGVLTPYLGTYSDYVAERERHILAEFATFKEQQKRIEHMEAAIKRLRDWANRAHPPNDGMHRRAASMQKALDRIVRVERPQERVTMRLALSSHKQSGQDVIRLDGITKTYANRAVFDNLTWSIRQGQKVGLVGANGAGKSTLVRLAMGALSPEAGTVHLGPSVRLGILSQQIWGPDANPNDRVIDRFRSEISIDMGSARHVLARFLFYGDHVFRAVGSLSGGEQMRLRLAQLMQDEINTLVLDEPTNHLDIESRDVLESVLEEFTGTLLVVSHDRYFLNRQVDLIDWVENGQITRYPGPYDEVRVARSRFRNP